MKPLILFLFIMSSCTSSMMNQDRGSGESSRPPGDTPIGINMNYYARGFEEAFVEGYNEAWPDDPISAFREDFLADLEIFDTVRFHQWGRQEFNTESQWSDRQSEDVILPVGDERTWQEVKVPLIWHIRLCNVAEKNLWINIPTRASEDYVFQLARLIQDNLAPELRVYVEYSNEVWNYDYGDDGMFGPENPPGTGQYTVALNQGNEIGLGLSDEEQTNLRPFLGTEEQAQRFFDTMTIADYVVYASTRAWQQFQLVFGEDAMGDRIIRVLPGQIPDSEGEYPLDSEGFPNEEDFYLGLVERHLAGLSDPLTNPWEQSADAYTVASYFGIGLQGNDPNVFDLLWSDVREAIVAARVVRQRLDQYEQDSGNPISLVAYEGGIHIWPEDNPVPASQDPQIADIYTFWLDGISPSFDLINHYSLVSPHGRFSDDNAFGLKEYQGQPESEAPKYRAVSQWILGTE